MTNAEVETIITALRDIAINSKTYQQDYIYDNRTNVFWHKNEKNDSETIKSWFTLE
jgi:hypothetical protein